MQTHPHKVHPQTVEIPVYAPVHPSISPLAAELLLKVCDVLAREPRSYNQGWGEVYCGSPCCIFGHMAALGGCPQGECSRRQPVEQLGLTRSQFNAIYWPRYWPKHMQTTNHLSQITAAEGIARVEFFLAHGE